MGVSVLFGKWTPCYSTVWDPSLYVVELIFGVCFSSLLFIIYLLIFVFLFFLPCAQNRSGTCIPFYLFLSSKTPMSSYLSIFVSSFTNPDLLYQFNIDFLFPTSSCGNSGPSINILIFTCTGGRSIFFRFLNLIHGFPCIFFWWSFINPFIYWWFHECCQLCHVLIW